MMFSTPNLLLLCGVSSLAIAASVDSTKAAPPTHLSKGFRLRVHVTNKSLDYDPSPEGHYLGSYRLPGSIDRPMLACRNDSKADALIFYINGTKHDVAAGLGTLVTDIVGGSVSGQAPHSAYYYYTFENSTQANVEMNLGAGEKDLTYLSPATEKLSYLYPDTFMREQFSRNHLQTPIISHVDLIKDKFPDYATPVRLIPECAELPAVQPGSQSSHQFAQPSRCYDDVAAINWAKYM